MQVIKDIFYELQGLLDGKKTYLVGIAMICTGLANKDWQVVLNGIAILTGRAAISKI